MEQHHVPGQGGPEGEQPLLRAVTHMEPRDYRRFLYTAMFRRSAAVPGLLCALSLLAAFARGYSPEGVDWMRFLGAFAVYGLVCTVALCVLVEFRNRQSRRDPEIFQRRQVYEFYEDRIKTYMEQGEGALELPYLQLRQILEAKEYWVFFITSNAAMMLRKADLAPGQPAQLQRLLAEKMGDKYKSAGAGKPSLDEPGETRQ